MEFWKCAIYRDIERWHLHFRFTFSLLSFSHFIMLCCYTYVLPFFHLMLRSKHYKLLHFSWKLPQTHSLIHKYIYIYWYVDAHEFVLCATGCIWFGFPLNAFLANTFDRSYLISVFRAKFVYMAINKWRIADSITFTMHKLCKQIRMLDDYQNTIFCMHSGGKLTDN